MHKYQKIRESKIQDVQSENVYSKIYILNCPLIIYTKNIREFIINQKNFYFFFYRMFGTSGACGGCGVAIPATEFVTRAGGSVFHPKCFVCSKCSIHLTQGDR